MWQEAASIGIRAPGRPEHPIGYVSSYPAPLAEQKALGWKVTYAAELTTDGGSYCVGDG